MIKNYIKTAVRNLLRQKFFSMTNILGLAIGIAACLAILLFIQYELSFEKEHVKADRIYRVLTIDKALGTHGQTASISIPPLGPAIVETFPEVEAQLRIAGGGKTLLKYSNRLAVYARQMRSADENFFDFFDFTLIEGSKKTALSEPFTIILTETLAGQIFGDMPAMGKIIRTGGGNDVKVTGIMQDLPDNSHLNFDALLSMSTRESLARARQPQGSTQPIWLENWDTIAMPTYIMLKKGVSSEGLDEKFTQLCRKNGVEENFEVTIQPLMDVHLHSTEIIFGTAARKSDIKNIYIFSAIAILILLIAVINYTNLSTARSAQRAKEVALRKVVGSVRSKLITQFMVESLILTFIALLLALPLAALVLPFLNQILDAALRLSFFNNFLIPGFLLFLLFGIGILAGLYPAFALSAFKPVSVLKGNFKTGKSGTALRKSLVVFQFALSIALIGMTAIVQKQMQYIQEKNLGYDREQVMIFEMNDRRMGQRLETFRKELTAGEPFVNAAASSNIPGRTFGRTGLQPQGAPEDEIWIMSTFSISPETLPTLGMEIIQGRNFSRQMSTDTAGVVLINESAVKKLDWAEPLNKRFYFNSDSVGVRVIGVVKDFHFIGMHQPIEPVLIRPLNRFPGRILTARVKTGQLQEAIEFAERKWREIYPEYPFSYNFMDDEFNNLYQRDTNTSKIVNIFSVLAVFIACMGLFSLSSHSTMMRIKEIGVRKVLGASEWKIIRLLVFEFVKWVVVANIFAWPLAWYAASVWLDGFAYRVEMQPLLFLTASIIAVIIAVLTVLGQSWRAALMNPAAALRYE